MPPTAPDSDQKHRRRVRPREDYEEPEDHTNEDEEDEDEEVAVEDVDVEVEVDVEGPSQTPLVPPPAKRPRTALTSDDTDEEDFSRIPVLPGSFSSRQWNRRPFGLENPCEYCFKPNFT